MNVSGPTTGRRAWSEHVAVWLAVAALNIAASLPLAAQENAHPGLEPTDQPAVAAGSGAVPGSTAMDSIAWIQPTPSTVCQLHLDMQEDEVRNIELTRSCQVPFDAATPLSHDRVMWLHPDATTIEVRTRRFDGGRTAESHWALWRSDRLVGLAQVQITIQDSVAETRWVHSSTARNPGFELQTWLPVLDGHAQGHPDYPLLVTIPEGDSPMPVEVFLHGFMGEPRFSRESDHVTIMPSDPNNTYWWGDSSSGVPTPWVQWMVVDAVAALVPNIPRADPDRVVIAGASMGGAGAAVIGMTWPELFAGVVATDGQAVPRNHRARRVAQLSGLWGPMSEQPTPGGQPQPGWDTTDLTWLLDSDPRIHQLPFISRYGRDDAIIHFGALTESSPLGGQSWLSAMQQRAVPWLLAWDPGGHVNSAPLAERWWLHDWNRMTDGESWWSRAFPTLAVTCEQLDGDPGDGTGNGRRERHPDAAFAGDPAVVGDDGWTGQEQGVRGAWVRWYNRSLRASAATLTFELSLHPPEYERAVCDIIIGRTGVFAPPATADLEWSDGADRNEPVIRRADGRIQLQGVSLSSSSRSTISVRWVQVALLPGW